MLEIEGEQPIRYQRSTPLKYDTQLGHTGRCIKISFVVKILSYQVRLEKGYSIVCTPSIQWQHPAT